MDTITKYASIGLGAICALLIIYCLLLRNDRDEALNKIDSLNGQLNTAITANLNLKGSIDLLEKQAEQNRSYITQLEEQRTITSKKAMEELEKFKNAKKTNPPVNNWADIKLPNGLY
ncbi:hypothetical protein DM558_06295 [Entomomonas moraniae]|uniref:DUF2570 domain-containing protein n=1 Tax=Entomomonas moraniae TaxID=2213226 RepID=A0A3Q9JLJ8_9GAMM|nr:hypothetical protein [Entomomonas moraniae]AZS50408.1 hypothetical protein DM558_06295 [Entomomonas moraniae]